MTAALKEQFERHCFIKIKRQSTQPMLVPFVKRFYTTQKNLAWYKEKALLKHDALNPGEVDVLIEAREQKLLRAAKAEPITTETTIDTVATKPKR